MNTDYRVESCDACQFDHYGRCEWGNNPDSCKILERNN